jgi:DNA-binding MarR family transcriptional regulator
LKKQNIDSMLEQRTSADMCTCGELRKAARAVTMLYDNAVKSSGLQSTQFSLLHVISKSDSIRISELAATMGTDRTTLTRNLAILERDGLIKVSEGTDHRTRIVTATQKGRGAIVRAIPLWNEVQHKVKQKMGESSWQGLMRSLSEFLKVTDQLTDQDDKSF